MGPKPITAFLNRLKFFALIAILLVTVLAVGHQYRQYRFSQLSADFESLPADEKLQRLDQLSTWGHEAMPTLVAALADQDAEIAKHAHEELRELQSTWPVIEFEQAVQHQKNFVDSIREKESGFTEQGRTLAADLLRHVAQLSVEQSNDATRRLYFSATAAIDKLSATQARVDDSEPPATVEGEIDERSRPLPVDHLARSVDWTDWPPRRDQPTDVTTAALNASLGSSRPAIHRTKTPPLQAVAEGEVIVLHEPPRDRMHMVDEKHSVESMYTPPAAIQPVVHIIQTPWQDADFSTVINFLGRSEQDLKNQAETELARRGLSEHEISFANQIATGDSQSKIALIESMSQSPNIDARPWLMLLLDDRNREVRLRSISALAAMKDAWVQQQLKLRMVDEQDQTVAFRIRRVLNLR